MESISNLTHLDEDADGVLHPFLGGLVAELLDGDQDSLPAVDLAEDEHHRGPVRNLRHHADKRRRGGGREREGCCGVRALFGRPVAPHIGGAVSVLGRVHLWWLPYLGGEVGACRGE